MTDAAMKAALEAAMAEWMTDPHTLEEEHRVWIRKGDGAGLAARARADRALGGRLRLEMADA